MERFRGGLSRYDGHVGIFPSKADRIMSSYRRIAPKPTVPSASDANKSASSAVSFDSLCVRQVPNAPTSSSTISLRQKTKRVRKRASNESETSESSKRLAISGSVPNLAEKGVSHASAAEAAPSSIQEDVGFMERAAAASAPSSVFPAEKTRKALLSNAYGFSGCFTEMIRGITGLPSSARVPSLFQQQQQQPSLQGANLLSFGGPEGKARASRDHGKEGGDIDAVRSCFHGECPRDDADRGFSEEQQQSGLDEENSDGEDDGRRRAATLNLLPEAPTRGGSPSISSCTSLRQNSEQGNSICENSLVYVEQMYGDSVEPVVLIHDMSRTVLWENHSYSKACWESFQAPATFVDPLGIPTQLGKLQVRLDGRSERISATLWGFLKKLVVELGEEEASREKPCDASLAAGERGKEKQLWRPASYQQQKCSGTGNSSPSAGSSMSDENDSRASASVITPQPVRVVGSMVSLESITEARRRDPSSSMSLESAKKQLEGDSLPGFITDAAASVVRWVNCAYKAMVGQPECRWLAAMANTGGEPLTITGEVSLSCNVEVPRSVTSFSGRANVQWTRNTGERSCMTVPCDVWSVAADSSARRMLMWRFDVQASLSLNCGLGR